MNKRLLAALLTFAIMPVFAQETAINNAELLAHLQQVKIDTELPLAQLSAFMKQMNEQYSEGYKEIENATRELYNIVAESVSSDIDHIFNELCNQMIPLKDMNFQNNSIDAFEHLFKDNFIDTHKQEIESILNKYSKNDPNFQEKSTWPLEKRIIDYFFTSGDSLAIVMMVTAQEICTSILNKIDAKIAELACHSKPLA